MLPRRKFLQFASLMGLAPVTLTACSDDETDGSPRPTADAGMPGDGSGLDPTPPLPDPPPEYTWDGPVGPDGLFVHGVASGDPLSDAVVLWTRVSPDAEGPIEVWYELALDPQFTTRIAAGTFTTGPERDYTVKVDATGLWPGTTYYYVFKAQGRSSLVGRTRTAPVGQVDRLRFAVVSCSNFADGYFHVYRSLAEQADLAAILHLGDYIYEYGSGSGERTHEPRNEIVSLSDYRTRYGQYRRDVDLMAAHQQHPFIPVWDDHESTNNSWFGGAENHNEGEGDWETRKSASVQAWFEWMPVRDTPDGRIWRTLRYGDLADFVMLDTRLWGRDEQAGFGEVDVVEQPGRTLLGDEQEAWLLDQISTSTAQWKFLGQQVMLGHLQLGEAVLNTDQWDGYPESRARLLNLLRDQNISDVVVLTGDIHTSWAMDISEAPSDPSVYDPETGAGTLAVEFVAPSVTSDALEEVQPSLLDIILGANPHMRWVDLQNKGYVLVDVTPERVQGAWFFVSSVVERDFTETFARAYSTTTGRNHLTQDDAPAPAISDAPELAPDMPQRA
jgi:alkaline phosphatase D